MTLSDISIRRPVFAWMLMLACVVFGTLCLGRLGVSQLPDVASPILTVSVTWSGAAPEVMEAGVVDPLEEQLVEVQGIKNMTSTISDGTARIKLEFYGNQDIDAALQSVNSRVQSVTLPAQADPPTISKVDTDSTPILWMVVTWKGHSFHDLVEYIDLHLRDKFMVVPGVGDVQLGGWSNRTMRIWVDNKKLAPNELTILDVRDTITNDYQETASGYIENNLKQLNIRTMGEEKSAAHIGNLYISQRSGGQIVNSPLRIKDVATVDDGLDDIRRFSRSEGLDSIGLGFRKQFGSNEVEVAQNILDAAKQFQHALPPGMELGTRFNTTTFTKNAIHETELTVLLSVVVTSLVCWLFLGSWSATLNVLFSIPTSILGTFVVIYFFGFTLNFFTLLGLSLAVGIVVDDAIMVLENIFRHFQMGKDKVRASLDGAREITFAALAATVSIVAVFSPVLFINGQIGAYLYQFGVTISAAVMLSLLEAITLTPMRCSQFMQRPENARGLTRWIDEQFQRFARGYRWVLEICLRFRWGVLILSALCFALSLHLYPLLTKELIPSQDIGAIMLRFTSQPDASLERTSDLLKPLEDYLQTLPYVSETFTNVGGYSGGEVTTGNIYITLVDRSKRSLSQQEIVTQLRSQFAKMRATGVRVQVIDVNMGAFSSKRGTRIELSLQGPEYSVLRDKANEIMDKLDDSNEFTDSDIDYREGSKELHIIPDREKAAANNVPILTIADTLNAAIGGINVGEFTNGDRRYEMRLRLQTGQWQTAQDVDNLMIHTSLGETIPITDVITTKTASTLQSITKENRDRSITLFANNSPDVSAEKATQDAIAICRKVLPEGYRVELTGASQSKREIFSNLGYMLILGFVVAYMVLATQFNSFIHPCTVLTTLPFTFTGAFLSLYLTECSLNIYSAIGIVLLMGIAKKNSILLVEFFNRLRFGHGKTTAQAILEGGPIRLRPILMTSLATVAAAIPAAIGFGPGAEVREPLAIVIIGGVIVSTAFTLLVIPCVYSLCTALESKSGQTQSRRAYAEGDSPLASKPGPAVLTPG